MDKRLILYPLFFLVIMFTTFLISLFVPPFMPSCDSPYNQIKTLLFILPSLLLPVASLIFAEKQVKKGNSALKSLMISWGTSSAIATGLNLANMITLLF